MYNLLYALEISRIVHEERIGLTQQALQHEPGLGSRLAINMSSLHRMRKAMNRVMSLFF